MYEELTAISPLALSSYRRNLLTLPAMTPVTPWRPDSSASSAPAATRTSAEVGLPCSSLLGEM